MRGRASTDAALNPGEPGELTVFKPFALVRRLDLLEQRWHDVTILVKYQRCWHNSIMSNDEENMSERFRGRFSPDQKREWEKAARLARRNLSDWIRLSLDDLAAEQIEASAKKKRKK